MKNRAVILLAFAFSGVSALIYEVTWTRALSLVLGSTTYALSTMLSTFMAGLAIGSYIGGKLADNRKDLIKIFAYCEAGIGIFGLITIPLIYSLPPFYLYLFRMFRLSPQLFYALQFVICSIIMLIPTTLMGITFPLVSRSITRSMEEMGSKIGNAYSINTFGAIIGSFSAGFILIPMLGIKNTTFVAAIINLGIAILLICFFSNNGKKILLLIGALFLISGGTAAYSEQRITFVSFYTAFKFLEGIPLQYFFAKDMSSHYKTVYYKEYPEGAVRLYRDMNDNLLMQTGGKIEGNTEGDMVNTLLLADLPIASHRNPESFLVIGLGLGTTLVEAKAHLKNVDLVEINPGVVDAVRKFGPAGIFDGVPIYYDDARQYLLLSEKKYDIISSEPSYPTEASVANLFTREFYQIAKEKLNTGGIYCQWLPYYLLADDDVTMMLKTFGSSFKHVYLWKVGDSLDRIMIGSDAPFAFSSEEVMSRVKGLNKTKYSLDCSVSRDPQAIAEIVKSEKVPVNTDDMPYLEFNAVRQIILGKKI